MSGFLPISKKDMADRGWEDLDFVYVIGDAYVDHPSFGPAIISRMLEANGYKVGIISQPDWQDVNAFKKLGRPRLGFLISSGNIDSMVSHYSVNKKKRRKDVYSPGGKAGLRPDRALIVYSNKVREAYKDMPIIIGGLEASLRRFAHYDYWSDKVRKSVLLDAKADLIIYGMGEKQIVGVADALDAGIKINEITYLKGTVFKTKDLSQAYEPLILPSFETIAQSKKEFAKSFKIQHENNDAINGETLVEAYEDSHYYIVQNPPEDPLSQDEMDQVYALPYKRTYHPVYESSGGIEAIREVEFSLVSNRGCFGNCSFCALTYHQGRSLQMRSHESIIEEAKILTQLPNFKGYIHDLGGPTANFRHKACVQQEKSGVCKNKECLAPKPCKNLKVDHQDYLNILRKLRNLEGVKKVFIRSGIRFDYLVYDQNEQFFNELCQHHISGNLKVAPEHVSEHVLEKMGKPSKKVFEKFLKKFKAINTKLDKEQYIIPYFISSHPGARLKDAIELAEYIRDMKFIPEQVQDFYPTPGTLSTCMYYTELDPQTMKAIYVPKSVSEKSMQRALMQFNRRENYKLVHEALKSEGRDDLIGYGPKCLIKPKNTMKQGPLKKNLKNEKIRRKC